MTSTPSISITESGRNSTTLSAHAGNELTVRWQLTNGQLAHLAAEAVAILKRRAESKHLEISELKNELQSLLEE